MMLFLADACNHKTGNRAGNRAGNRRFGDNNKWSQIAWSVKHCVTITALEEEGGKSDYWTVEIHRDLTVRRLTNGDTVLTIKKQLQIANRLRTTPNPCLSLWLTIK